ncbi:amidohydrolase [Actinocatenispora thailandica]|uniref:Amidohydrolase n=1 Tax=Actinocatenispora thailandica TaxID=227318 RepID=A0A7R7DMP6_9ACTN|nr:amidohydrolase family protein [Actinocatenispora thailandica]BCJ34336.1 amidohydrolase [Actinocatenispora thailandica]
MIDCHAHLWDPAAGHPWIRPGSPHHRSFGIDDLAAADAGTGAESTGTILVEASRGDAGETLALAETYRTHPGLVAGYVANLHVHAAAGPARFAALLDRLGAHRPHGMRLGGAELADTPAPERALLPVLAERGVVLELHLGRNALTDAAALAAREPALTVVVDHLGNPPHLRTDGLAGWRRGLALAAARPNVVVKLSGLATQQRGVPGGRVAALVGEVVDAVGPDRCVVGSDWPICLPAATRAESLALARAGLAGLTAAERERALAGTATRIYRLRPARHGGSAS